MVQIWWWWGIIVGVYCWNGSLLCFMKRACWCCSIWKLLVLAFFFLFYHRASFLFFADLQRIYRAFLENLARHLSVFFYFCELSFESFFWNTFLLLDQGCCLLVIGYWSIKAIRNYCQNWWWTIDLVETWTV